MNPTFKVWQIEIDENDIETGVEYVALVDDPAILRTWQAFSTANLKYKVDSDRQIVQGPLMVPHLPIYRNDPMHGEHYVTYTPETIAKICRKFFRQKNTGNVNLMHMPLATTNGAYMFESFIIDSSRGIRAPEGFTNLPDGTWFGSYHVTDPEIWKAVNDGTFRGFSVEGFFTYEASRDVDAQLIQNIIDVVQNGTPQRESYLSSISPSPGMKEKLSEAFKALKTLFMEPAQAVLKDGTQVVADGGFVQGATLSVVTPDGNIPAPDGSHTMADGTVIETMGGVIMNVTAPEAEKKDETQNPAAPEQGMEQYNALKARMEAFESENFNSLKSIQESLKQLNEKFTAAAEENKSIKARLESAAKIIKSLEETPATTPVEKEMEQRQEDPKPRFIVDEYRGHYQKMKEASRKFQ